MALRSVQVPYNTFNPLIASFMQIYNRTSTQQSTLLTNGHIKPVERLRYMDRYLVSGGRDAKLKIWSL